MKKKRVIKKNPHIVCQIINVYFAKETEAGTGNGIRKIRNRFPL